MKKLFSRMVLATSMMFALTANASLILTEDASFTTSNGGFDWQLGDNVIPTFDPIQIVNATGFFDTDIFTGAVSNIGLGATGQPINTSGGNFSIANWYRFVSPNGDGLIAGATLSFVYNVVEFTQDEFRADLNGSFTFNGETFDVTGDILGANNPGTNNSAWQWNVNYLAPLSNTPGNSATVDAPPSLLLFSSLLLVAAFRKKKSTSLIM